MDAETFAARRDALRPILDKENLDALIVSHAANRYYLSGFELFDPQCNESAGVLVVAADGNDRLLTDSRYLDAARRLWPEEAIHVYKVPKYEDMGRYLDGLNLGRVGFESPSLPHAAVCGLREHLPLTPSKGLVEKLRLNKDEAEIAALKRSCALNHRCVRSLEEMLAPGMTEAEAAWEIEKFYRENGAEALSFETIVGVGENAALPHAIPSQRTLERDQLVLVDMGCRLKGYCSDQTRTLWLGREPSARFVKVRDQVRRAQDAAIELVKPGVAVADLYHAARASFEEQGVAEFFTHALGHGIGLETHEPPSVGPHATGSLVPGMVFTVEPGLYYPDWGGVRWEYMVLVTEDGCEIL